MKQWLKSWEFYYFGFWLFIIGLLLFFPIRQSLIEGNRIYTMTVDVYYTDAPERHTYVSDGVPIYYTCHRGVSRVAGEREYVSTTAPIKVISNTYREKK